MLQKIEVTSPTVKDEIRQAITLARQMVTEDVGSVHHDPKAYIATIKDLLTIIDNCAISVGAMR